jgi:hypothetical protein
MRSMSVMLSLVAVVAATAPADAQGRGRGRNDKDIPPGHRPPAGMCRIWIDGVPPGRQPAPTDCQTAVRNQPVNSRIIWGDNTTGRNRNVDDNRRERRDRDRRIRDRESGGSVGVDRDQYPSQLPAMTGAVLIRVGVRTTDVQNWLGGGTLRSETVDANGDGVPEQATWYDGSGTVLQVWRDEDRDGRADSVDIYRNGQRVQVIR